MAEVTLKDVTKVYPNGFQAVTDLSLRIADGEFLVLVGPSGCGKSTALRMIAGLEEITSGEMRIGDRLVNKLPPKDRDIAMVFQNYALYPHMTVFDNIAFALKLAKVPKDEIKARVDEAAAVLELGQYLNTRPAQLSGGQRQRVAMGRAIVRQPAAFLMDEPLSNLDAKLRVQMRAEIARIQQKLGVTTFYVTHDQVEAMTMADRVAVIDKGILQQVDSPQKLYDEPDNLFVAAFIGSPAMNVFEAVITDGGGLAVEFGSHSVALPDELLSRRPHLRGMVNQPTFVGIRPEDLDDASLRPGHPADQVIHAKADLIEALGAELLVHLVLHATPVTGVAEPGLPEELDLDQTGGTDAVCVGRFNPRSQVKEGETIPVTVDAERLHFFDTVSGEAIRE